MRIGIPNSFTVAPIYYRLIRFIASQLNETPVFVPIETRNGNRTVFEYLLDGSVDCFPDLWIISSQRLSQKLIFSDVLLTVSGIFDVPDSSQASLYTPTLRMMRIFSTLLWTMIFITALGFMLLVALHRFFSLSSKDPKINGWQWWQHFTTADTVSLSKLPVRLMLRLGMTSLFTLSTLTLFQGCLLVQLVKPSVYHPEVNSMKQLAEFLLRDDTKLDLVFKDTHWAQELHNPYSEWLILNEALRRNPPIYTGEEGAAAPGYRIVSARDESYQLDPTMRHCAHHIVKTLPKYNMALMVSPHAPELLRSINRVIQEHRRYLEAILHANIADQQTQYERCRQQRQDRERRHVGDSLPIVYFLGAIMLLAIGLMVAVWALAIEKLCHVWIQSTENTEWDTLF